MNADHHATADWILRAQRPDGAIPWEHGGCDLDPWNHTEAAMGLDAAGRHDAAALAYRWLSAIQNDDGSWYAHYHHGEPTDHARDTSFTAYIAVGVLHHYLSTHDTSFLTDNWPTVDRAITYTLTVQRPTGEFTWRQDPDGNHTTEALLTGNSSIYHALRSATALITITGHIRPQWKHAAAGLRTAITTQTALFTPKPHAMDWYYPILGGTIDSAHAQERLEEHWHRFVVPDHGVRCVDHEPWITAAETAELALTLATHDAPERAAQLLESLHHLRHDDGSYWTGYNYATNTIWPRERTTWTAGAILLATAAVASHQPTLITFRPARPDPAARDTGR